jgi:hypothetical protein
LDYLQCQIYKYVLRLRRLRKTANLYTKLRNGAIIEYAFSYSSSLIRISESNSENDLTPQTYFETTHSRLWIDKTSFFLDKLLSLHKG